MNKAKEQNVSSMVSRTLFCLLCFPSFHGNAGTEWVHHKFPQRIDILGCFPKCKESSLFRTCILLIFVYSDIKRILTKACPTQHLRHFRWNLYWEDKHILLIEEGLALWVSTSKRHSGENGRPGPFGLCSAAGKGPTHPLCVIHSLFGHNKSERRVAKSSAKIYRIFLEIRQAFHRFILALTMLPSYIQGVRVSLPVWAFQLRARKYVHLSGAIVSWWFLSLLFIISLAAVEM